MTSVKADAVHVCPTCEQVVTEVRVTVTGVCPTHGITPIVCGEPGCWCAEDSDG